MAKTDETSGGAAGQLVSRRIQILRIAAQLFARRGYQGTSMRDIGEDAGVLGGSLYHHFRSKDALFIEVYTAALDDATIRIEAAILRASDPWERLERACATLLEIQLAPESLTLPMTNDFRAVPPEVRRELIKRRDLFEEQFRGLVAALPLPAGIDRSIYRNLLLSLLNAAGEWYRPGRLSPREIAAQVVAIFRHPPEDLPRPGGEHTIPLDQRERGNDSAEQA